MSDLTGREVCIIVPIAALCVLIGVYLIGHGWWWLDGLLTLGIALAILRVIVDIIGSTSKILADAQVVPPEKVERVVMGVPGACFCHAIRSRGRQEGFFLDLHLGVAEGLPIRQAHDVVCHNVKQALHDAFPALKSANIHIEPDNEEGRRRRHSVFRHRDTYGL